MPSAQGHKRRSPLVELTKARVREFYREPGAVFWVFGFPILMAVGLGLAFRSQPPQAPRVVVVESEHQWVNSALNQSRAGVAAQKTAASDQEDSQQSAPPMSQLNIEYLNRAEASRGLHRARFDIMVVAGPWPKVTYHFDATRPEANLARLAVDRVLQRAGGQQDVIESHSQAVSEKGTRYIDFLLPGLIAMNLMSSSMWGIGYNIALQRKRRMLKRLAATPMRRSHLLLSYIFSRLIFLTFELAALLTFGLLAFDVTVQGSMLAMVSVSVLGAMSFAGIALLVAARVESMEAVNGLLNAVMLPMWLLSGTFFSYERFPEWMQPIVQALPLTALNDALRGITNDGAALYELWPQLAVLGGWGALSMVLALRFFRWK